MEPLQMKENLPTVWRIPNDEWNNRHVEVMQRMYKAGQNPIKFDAHHDFVEVTCEYTGVEEEPAPWEEFLSDVYTDVVEAIEGGDHTTEELMEMRETEFGDRERKSVLAAIDEKLQPSAEEPEEEEPEPEEEEPSE